MRGFRRDIRVSHPPAHGRGSLRTRPWALLIITCGCCFGACAGGGSEPRPRGDAGPDAATFVGTARCADCHVEATEQWRGSHHDRAMEAAAAGTVLGDFDDARFEQGGETTRFYRRDGRYLVEATGEDGLAGEFEVRYTFGVEPLQQYLVGLPGGRLQALDVAWDARPIDEGGQRWFHLQPDTAYPPGDPLHWSGIAFNWNTMCADCHSTGFARNYDLETATYASDYAEVDVGCEACHGPGSAHVAWAGSAAEAGAAAAGGLTAEQMGLVVGFLGPADAEWRIDTDTGLAQRSPVRSTRAEIDTCGRCHARRGPLTDSYGFSAPLTDSYRVALLEPGLYHDDGQILDEVYVYGSFLQSRMYQMGVSCNDCHAPHGLQLYSQGNALCNRCHLAERFDTVAHHRHEVGGAGSACIDCHMPATTYMVVDPRRDHGFRVPRPDLSVGYGTPNACTTCHRAEGAQWSADAVARWFGPDRPPSWVDRLVEGRSGRRSATTELRALARDPAVPGIVRATALAEGGAADQAAISTIASGLGDVDPLVRLGALLALDAADPVTVARLAPPLLGDRDRSVRLEATRLLASIPVQQVPQPRRAALRRAVEEWRAAQMVNADRAQAHLNLGWLATRQGDFAAAEGHYRTALRLEPYFVPTRINLADLYRVSGRDTEAEAPLRQAIEIAPDSAEARHALGLLLVRLGRLDEAVDELRLAAELAPEQPRYVYVHAVAVHTTGDAQGAIALLDGGLERFPADRELLFGAAAFSRDLGEIERALGYARTLAALDPADPQAAAFVRELESMR